MQAVLFGSIGSVVETSELQRTTFNEAFAVFDLDWHWDRDTYREMLTVSGGADRVARYAAERGIEVDAAAIHAKKTEFFQAALWTGVPPLRRGVCDVMRAAKARGQALGFVTTTSPQTVKLIVNSVESETGHCFDLVTSRDPDRADKPDPAVYHHALKELGITSKAVLAIEDNADGVTAACRAGIHVVGFPGRNTRPKDLSEADVLVMNGSLTPFRDVYFANTEAT